MKITQSFSEMGMKYLIASCSLTFKRQHNTMISNNIYTYFVLSVPRKQFQTAV